MKKTFFPIFALFAVALFFAGMFGNDPVDKSKFTNNERPSYIQDPVVPVTDAIVKFVDSLNGANDTVALRTRGYIPKRGPAGGPAGTKPNWYQGQTGGSANWVSFNGPTNGYVGNDFNFTTGTNTVDLWLILPAQNVAAGDTLSFYERSGLNNTFPDSMRVFYAANGDTVPGSGSFVELGRFLNTTSGSWAERRFVAPSAGANGRFAINYRVANGGPSGANSFAVGVDFIRILGPAPIPNTTLLLTHDSTVVNTQAERKRDRDSMRTYLGGLVGGYDFITFDSNTVLPSLTQYSRIVIQETAFDGQPARYLGLAQRNAIIAWLNSGTAGNRKTLVHIGGDLGYNYSRTGSGALDLNFSNTISGYNYKLDNAYPSPGNVVGVGVDVGNTRTISGTTNYYPDGCSMTNGSFPLYRYGNHTVADTLAGVMRYTATYEVRSLFSDPRYYSGAGGWQPVLAALLGAITGVNQVNNTVPEVYSLSQNYPNPFNPSTNIKFAIPQAGNVKMVVFDVLGREVVTLVNEFRQAGNYVVDFNASALSSGVYFYRIDAGNFTQTKKMLLVK